MCLEAGSELNKDVRAVGVITPAFVEVPEASKRIKVPVIVMPSQNEPDYVSLSNFYHYLYIPDVPIYTTIQSIYSGFHIIRLHIIINALPAG